MRVSYLAIAGVVFLSAGSGWAQSPNSNVIGNGLFGDQGSGVASLGAENNTPTRPPSAPSVYNDAARGFMLVAPPGTTIEEREPGKQIAIQSRRGYAVNVQVGDAAPNRPTADMFAKLEAKYLGDGRPWHRKTAEGELVIAGLPAAEAIYEAASTRTRVVIARGQKTDFVFMFFAPITHFEKLSRDHEWILAGFRPATDERPETPPQVPVVRSEPKEAPPLRAQEAPVVSPSGRGTPTAMPELSDVNVFAEPGYGYRLEFPAQWVLEKASAFTNLISGPEGSPAYEAIVALQNVQPNRNVPTQDAVMAVVADLKAQLQAQAQGVQFYGEKPIIYDKFEQRLNGAQFVADYQHEGRAFRKWALVLPRPAGDIVHIWSYTAPLQSFDLHRSVAENILNSLRIEGDQG